MHDSMRRQKPNSRARPLKGLAFDIGDLELIRLWADERDFQMAIHLDHGAAEGEDYEEVISLQPNLSSLHWFIMWRTRRTVLVQALVGRRRSYGSVSRALTALLPKQEVTDITPSSWPRD